MSAVVVVGASSEIGREVAVSFARLGREVHAWGRNAERLRATVVACKAAGAAQVVQTLIDVRDTRHLREAVRTVTAGGTVTDVVWAGGDHLLAANGIPKQLHTVVLQVADNQHNHVIGSSFARGADRWRSVGSFGTSPRR